MDEMLCFSLLKLKVEELYRIAQLLEAAGQRLVVAQENLAQAQSGKATKHAQLWPSCIESKIPR